MAKPVPLVIHGWTVFAHPLFLTPSKVIVFAWVYDDDSKRACASGDDAYRVFHRLLASGNPPDDGGQLLAEAQAGGACLQQFAAGLPP